MFALPLVGHGVNGTVLIKGYVGICRSTQGGEGGGGVGAPCMNNFFLMISSSVWA